MISNSVIRQRTFSDSYWRPRSLVVVKGRPEFANHRSAEAQATVSAVMSLMGTASDHRVKPSIQVKRWEYPFESFKCSTIPR